MNASLVDWQYLVINLHISGPKTLTVVCQTERYRASAASLVQSLEPIWYWNLEKNVIKLKFGRNIQKCVCSKLIGGNS